MAWFKTGQIQPVFTLIKFVVRQALQKTEGSLAGLYDGNPRRTTGCPSAEQLLHAFSDITLSPLGGQILALMNIPESIYPPHLRLCKT